MTELVRIDEATFLRLEKLSRSAALDSMSAKGGYLADDQFDALAASLLEIGVRAFERYDPELAGGVAQETYAYRAMRGYRGGQLTEGPYTDWLRTNVRDSRFEPDMVTSLTDTGDLPELEEAERMAIDDLVERHARGLNERDAWTLRHVAAALAGGLRLEEVIEGLLADLADALQPEVDVPLTTSLESFEGLFDDWMEAA